jgi:8-oxo-dGTP diphosphatase
VLLGLKKRDFGAGRYTGFGGKIESGETPARAAVRELWEETRVNVEQADLEPMGQLTFLFPAQPSWSQTVHVFVTERWRGGPLESDEMLPAWFAVDGLPLDQMWQDGAHWLPPILSGQRILGRFVFRMDNETIDTVEITAWDGQ